MGQTKVCICQKYLYTVYFDYWYSLCFSLTCVVVLSYNHLLVMIVATVVMVHLFFLGMSINITQQIRY